MKSILEHVEYLSKTIGPRGSTTENELKAARYIEAELKSLGLKPTIEEFKSATSGWYPFAIFSGLLVLSEILFVIGYPSKGLIVVLSSLLAFFALACVVLELAFVSNPYRWILPKAKSQNVWVNFKPLDAVKEKVIIVAHMDSHRSPIAFSSPSWVKVFDIIVPVGLASAFILAVLFGVSIFYHWQYALIASTPFALVLLFVFVITMQPNFTQYVQGANDNASGVAVALKVAEELKAATMKNIEVYLVFSGCEEVGCYGASAFARHHKKELGNAAWVTVDSVASSNAELCYLTHEKFMLDAKSDKGLIDAATAVSKNHPELGARACSNFVGAYTESSIGLINYGHRVITLIALSPDGRFENWHQVTDTIENLDAAMLDKSFKFTWELIKELDKIKV